MAKFKRIYRLNSNNRWVTYHYSVCRPANTDIVTSSAGRKFETLVNSYPYAWHRASNMPFINTGADGQPLGYLLADGTQLYAPDWNVEKRRAWAMSMLDTNGNIRVVEASPDSGAANASNDSLLKMKATYGNSTVGSCKWACAVGPLPIGGADLSEWASRDYPDPYDNSAGTRREVGIALLSDGLLLHIAGISGWCCKNDIANVISEFSPVWFQIFDGGGSVGLIDKNEAGVNLGFNDRIMRAAFIVRQAEEIPLQHNRPDCTYPDGWIGETPCASL